MRWLTTLLVVGGLAGCSVTFRFAPPPKPYTGVLRLEDCVHKHAIHLRPARSSVQKEPQWNPRVYRALQSRGWSFYRKGKRLSAVDALTLLGEPALRKRYLELWRPTERRGKRRVQGGAIGLGAAALFLVTGGAFLHDVQPPKDGSVSKAARARHISAFVMLGLAAVGIVVAPIVMRAGYRGARVGEAFRTVFFSKDQEPALKRAVARYNRRVRAACLKRLNEAP